MAVRTASRYRYQARNRSTAPAIATVPELAIAARDDLGIFGEYVTGLVPASIHRQWFPYLVTGRDSASLKRIAGPNVSLLSFRGSAKTTWARIWAAWVIGHNPHIHIGWISYKEFIAIKSSRAIKRIIESPQYRQVFPNIRPSRRWGDVSWEIDKEFAGVSVFEGDATLSTAGITGAITSNRFHLVIYDDLIKSSKDIKNEEIREQMSYSYSEVIEPTVAAVPGSREVSLGTRFRRDDIHCTDFTTENGWEVIEQGAIVIDEEGNERSAWERLELERLQEIRDRNPIVFAFQWMNTIPPLSDDQAITEECIIYEDLPADLHAAELVLGVDLAASEEEKGDYTAFVLGLRTKHLIWILDVEEHRIKGNLEKIQKILALWRKWERVAPGLRVIFEKGAYQNSFEGDWISYRRMYRVRTAIRCEGVSIRGDKEEKLESISGVFQDKIVRFNAAKKRKFGRLIGQLLQLDQNHDDLRDACVFAFSRLQKRARQPLSSA